MSSPITFVYKKVGNVEISLDVWPPEASSVGGSHSNRRPALVWFHGGGGFFGDKGPDKSQWFGHWIKGRPLLVLSRDVSKQNHPDFTTKLNGHFYISANYRLLIPTTAHDMIDDIRDVFKFIAENLASEPIGSSTFVVDSTKLAAGGESFGGYLARLAGIHLNPKPKALVSMYGTS